MTDAPSLPAVFDYDQDRITASVLDGWIRQDNDRIVVLDLVRFLVRASGIAMMLIGGGVLATGATYLARAVLLVGMGALLFLAAVVGGRILRRRTGLRPVDIDLVLAHRREITVADWDQHDRTHADAVRAVGHRALAASRLITDTSLWTTEDIGHVLTLNPAEEARQIQVAVWRINQARAELGPRPIADGEAACREWDLDNRELDTSLSALERRTAALESYAQAVLAADRQAAIRRTHQRLLTFAGTTLAAIAADDARHELATEKVEMLEQDLRAAVDHRIAPAPDEH